ncbi:hypothetical protein MNBD_GAMMA12-1093 [hydrothermal vent metagenome]|uniref:Zinc finger/thioredoxin putative domain-containing protein n=1 Tax=hydrothermal vent metagenome TaxID=652676 RepID=A0A3B0Y825_9ZZZZ
MLTRCPKCQTLFRISESQLQRARGKTRCGQCFTVFEAKQATVEENTARVPQRRTQQKPQTQETSESGMSNAASSIYNEMVIKNQTVKYDIPDVLDGDDTIVDDFGMSGAPQPRPAAPKPKPRPPAPQRTHIPKPPTTPPPTAPVEQHSEEVTRRIEELRRKANHTGLEPATNILIDQQLNNNPQTQQREAPDNNFIPEVLQDDLYEEVHVPSARKNYFMILGILALLFVLLLQYIYFSRERLASNPTFHPSMVQFCKLFKCKVPYRKNLKLLHMKSFNPDILRSNNKFIVIHGQFFNRAKYVQPYPTIELIVENNQGDLVAMRRIYPEAYLPKHEHASIKKGLAPFKIIELKFIFKIPTKGDPSISFKFR